MFQRILHYMMQCHGDADGVVTAGTCTLPEGTFLVLWNTTSLVIYVCLNAIHISELNFVGLRLNAAATCQKTFFCLWENSVENFLINNSSQSDHRTFFGFAGLVYDKSLRMDRFSAIGTQEDEDPKKEKSFSDPKKVRLRDSQQKYQPK